MTTLPPSLERTIHKLITPGRPGVMAATGAGNRTRTGDPDLGKVVLYQLSYSRLGATRGSLVEREFLTPQRPVSSCGVSAQLGPGRFHVRNHRPERQRGGDDK